MSNGCFQTHGRSKLRIQFLDYSASREYLAQPGIVEYDGQSVSQPGSDLILGTNTLKELGIVLNFSNTKNDIDEMIMSMRDITKLSNRAKI